MNLVERLAVLRRRRVVFILCLLAGIGGGLYHGTTAKKSYTATSSTVISIPAGRDIQDALAGAQLSRQLLGTYTQVATSRKVAQRLVDQLGLPEDATAMRDKLKAKAEDGTYIIDVSATDADPVRAASLSDAAAVALSAEISALEAGKASPAKAQLLDRAVVPVGPTSPRPKRDLAAGGLLGFLLGTGLVFLLEALDRSIKIPSQGAHAFGAPLLGVVPRCKGGLGLVASTDGRSAEAEAIRAIRTSVRFLDPDSPIQVLLVTSPSAGNGKTSLAANLAISMALGGEQVLLIDGDLRRASLSTLLGLERAVGVTTVLARESSLDDSLQVWGGMMHVLPAGQAPPNAAELLGSQAMSSMLEILAQRYDMIIVDGPPVLPVTDPVVLGTQVDGVIMVARYGKTSRTGGAESARRLTAVGGRLVGFVLNAVPANESQAYYTTYGYAATPAARKAAH